MFIFNHPLPSIPINTKSRKISNTQVENPHKIEYIPKWFSLHINCDGFNNMVSAAKRISIPNLSFLHDKKSLIDLYNLENKKPLMTNTLLYFFLFMPCQSSNSSENGDEWASERSRAHTYCTSGRIITLKTVPLARNSHGDSYTKFGWMNRGYFSYSALFHFDSAPRFLSLCDSSSSCIFLSACHYTLLPAILCSFYGVTMNDCDRNRLYGLMNTNILKGLKGENRIEYFQYFRWR